MRRPAFGLLSIIRISILVLFSTISYGQFQSNTIGVVYLIGESADTYNLQIAFPLESLQTANSNSYWENRANNKLNFSGDVIFFDRGGELFKISVNTTFKITLWCENDGGLQYRPTWSTSVEKAKFKSRIKGLKEIQNIACFAIINKTAIAIERPDSKVSKDIVLEGDYDNDGAVDCLLWTYHDDAENCNGSPANQLGITLQSGKGTTALRCCGP